MRGGAAIRAGTRALWGGLIIERRLDGRRFRRATGLPDTPKGRTTAGLWDKMLDTLLEGRRSLLRLAS
jgi:hypothetical protein